MIYKQCKKVIESGFYNKEDMTRKLDVFLLGNRITETQYNELIAMMEQWWYMNPPLTPMFGHQLDILKDGNK